jgi:hypothetical protein
MSIRSLLVATALASLEPAHADGPRPIDAISVDVGEMSGVAYYTVGRDGLHVVTTLAQGTTVTPTRVVYVPAPGQSVAFSTLHQVIRSKSARQCARPQGEIGLELIFGQMAPSQRTGGRWRGRA